jgi:hypothetical protein
LSKLFDALIDLGFGVFEAEAEGVADGAADGAEGDAAGVEGEAEAGVSAGLSLAHPNSNRTEEASPIATATLNGEEGTGEPYRLTPCVRCGY